MKRRDFLTTSLAATALMGVAGASAPQAFGQTQNGREYYELRGYRLKPGAKPELLEAYLEKAAVPALNRLGIKPVGVFREIQPKEVETIFVLLPCGELSLLTSAWLRVAQDPEYRKAAGAYLETAAANPAFDRIDSWIMLAFSGLPRMDLPAYCRERKERLFELRTYESHNESKAQKKVDMFNSGEIQLMQELQLGPIFYGQALTGPNLPHLTYMTSGANEVVHKQHWDAFGKHPKWDQLKSDPQYAQTVSKMTKWMLKPAPYSQI